MYSRIVEVTIAAFAVRSRSLLRSASPAADYCAGDAKMLFNGEFLYRLASSLEEGDATKCDQDTAVRHTSVPILAFLCLPSSSCRHSIVQKTRFNQEVMASGMHGGSRMYASTFLRDFPAETTMTILHAT